MTNSRRHILHVDMDAFYASVEQLDHPEWRGKPLLVGGSPDGRGVVSTASYEARQFGCHSAMPTGQALRLCPDAIVVHPRMARYVQVSRQVAAILERYTPLIEPLSIDEAFLDVGGSLRLFGAATDIARRIQGDILDELHLTASIGVAPNKFLAKLASDLDKPAGLTIVDHDRVREFLDPLPVSRLWGVGRATLPRLEAIGVRTFADLRRVDLADLTQRFGQMGARFHRLARGLDDRPVMSDAAAKSISQEQTFASDIGDADALRAILLEQTEHVARRLRRAGRTARAVAIKLRHADFRTLSRRTTLESASDRTDVLWRAAGGLFDRWAQTGLRPLRLIGMGVEQLTTGGQQLSLFERHEDERRRRLDETADRIRARFGDGALHHGRRAGRSRPSSEE